MTYGHLIDEMDSSVFSVFNTSEFLDVSKNKLMNCSIYDLLINYNLSTIDKYYGKPLPLYIRDALGWTNIYQLKCYKPENMKPQKIKNNDFITISYDNKIILATTKILIPVYDMNSRRGFHGEIKYDYTLKKIQKLNESDYLMFFDYTSDKIAQFIPISKIQIKSVDINNIVSNNICFEIVTKSQFFNLNGFQLHI